MGACLFAGAADGTFCARTRLTAQLRYAHAASLANLWLKKRVPDTFFIALQVPFSVILRSEYHATLFALRRVILLRSYIRLSPSGIRYASLRRIEYH